MICNECASFIEDGMRFCSECGVAVSGIQRPQPLPSSSQLPQARVQGASVPSPAGPSGSINLPDPSKTSVLTRGVSKSKSATAIGAAAALMVMALAILLIWKPWSNPLTDEGGEPAGDRVQARDVTSQTSVPPPASTTPNQQSSPDPAQPPGFTAPSVVSADAAAENTANRQPVKNSPPTIRLTARSTQVTQGEDVELIAEASDKDGDSLSIAWNSSSGTLLNDGSRATLKTTSAQPGQVQLQATAADARGLSATSSLVITIVPRPPAIARFDADRTRLAAGEKVTFRVYPSESANDLTYRWESSTGSIRDNGPTATLDTSSADIGQITVTVTLADSLGRTATATKNLSVTTSPIASQAVIPRPGPVSVSASSQGDDLTVTLSGSSGSTGATSGTIDVMVAAGGSAQVSGYLPSGNCRWNLLAGENTKPNSLSFKEYPGPYNRFSRLAVRLRVNDNRRPARFTITWRLV